MSSAIKQAQESLVIHLKERKQLEDTLSTLNDTNDSDKSQRIALKTLIKNKQVLINEKNVFLANNFVPVLSYSNLLFDDNGNVKTNWSNEYEINGTTLGEIQKVELTKEQIAALENAAFDNINFANSSVTQTKEEKQDVYSINDNSPSKTVLLNETLSELETSAQLLQTFSTSLNDIDASKEPSIYDDNVEDVFSKSIRERVTQLIKNKSNYDSSLNLEEAAIIMRKKALDAFYTAKNSEEKQIAHERIIRTSNAITSNDPIVYKEIPWDPEQFAKLTQELNESNKVFSESIDILTVSTNNLETAKESGTEEEIEQAQQQFDIALADYNEKKATNLVLQDAMLGFHESEITTIMWPGSLTVGIQQSPINSPNKDSANNINSESAELYQYYDRVNGSFVAPKGYSISPITGQLVKNNEVTYGTGPNAQGLTSRATSTNPPEVDAYNDALAGQTEKIKQRNQVLQTELNSLTKTKKNNNDEIQRLKAAESLFSSATNPEALAEVEQIKQQINQLNVQNSQIDNNIITSKTSYNNDVSKIKAQDQNLKIDAAKAILASDTQRNANYLQENFVPTPKEAQAIYGDFKMSVDASNRAETNFSKTYQQAVNNAKKQNETLVAQGLPPVDPNNPSSWSTADKERVTNASDRVKIEHDREKTTASRLALTANTEEGRQALLDAGVDQRDINQILAADNLDSVGGVLSRQNIEGIDPSTLNGAIETQNKRGFTGFEDIAGGGAPFYLQMPTLKSITDFHLRNGINPYGKAEDEIARHSIHFNIFEITPPAPRAEIIEGSNGSLVRNVIDPVESRTIGSFTIYPSNLDDMSFTHNHQYESDNTISSLVNAGLGLVDSAQSLLTLAEAGIGSINQSKEQAISQRVTRKIDMVDFYKTSDPQLITLNFNLFTKDDFLKDIFQPLMFLTALGYPKRLLNGGLGNEIEGVAKQFKNATGVDLGEQQLANLSQNLDNFDEAGAELGGLGPFRYFITRRPEYISVRHSSGLFYYPMAAILKVDYTFKGPWYNSNSAKLENPQGNQLSFKEKIKKIGRDFADVFTNSGNSVNMAGLNKMLLNKNNLGDNYAYPTWAECSITVKSVVPLFRDDYLDLFYKSRTGGKDVVTVTEKQTGTNPFTPLNRVF